jgi:hypothetical protein
MIDWCYMQNSLHYNCVNRESYPNRSTWVHPLFLVGFVLILFYMYVICRSLFILLYFFFWPLCIRSSSIYRFWCFFGHCVDCSSSIYGFRLPLWHLQTFLSQSKTKNVLYNNCISISNRILDFKNNFKSITIWKRWCCTIFTNYLYCQKCNNTHLHRHFNYKPALNMCQ